MNFDLNQFGAIAEIVLRAGSSILKLRHEKGVTMKADGSPVTRADLAANEILCDGLSELFPNYPIVSEERAHETDLGTGRFVFLVDPLDGTKEFVRGSDEFTVNIALLEGSDPIFGVVYAPTLKVIFAGCPGTGARRAAVEDQAIGTWHPIHAVKPTETLRALVSHSHLTPQTREFLDGTRVSDIRAIGSSLKFCLIAAGDADIYPRMGPTMEWDTAAGDAILRAAGGRVLTLDQQPLRYLKPDRAGPNFRNPWFVAAGNFDPFNACWHRSPAEKSQ